MIEDPSLPLPASSEPPEPLDGPSDLLAVASPAAARPFLLASGSTRVVGVETTGVDQIRSGDVASDPPDRSPIEAALALLLARPRLRPASPSEGDATPGPGPAANVIASPRAIRRETAYAGGSLVETVLLPERLPGVVIEWGVRSATRSGASGGEPPELHLSFEVPRPTSFRTSGEHLLLRSSDDGVVRLVRVTPAPSSWRVVGAADRENGEGEGSAPARVVATVPLDRTGLPHGEGRVTLLAVLADDVEGAASLLGRTARVRLHERRADEALRSAREELLALRTGVVEMDDGLEWAKARMTSLEGAARRPRSSPPEPPGEPPASRHALEILGLASVGAHARAAVRLDALGATTPAEGAVGVVSPSPEAWLAHAAYASWSGRPHPMARDPGRLLGAARALRADEIPSRLQRAALRAVADLLDALGLRNDAEEVRGGIGRAVRLPTVGSASPEPADASRPSGSSPTHPRALGGGLDPLASVALDVSSLSDAGHGSPSARALRSWAHYANDAPDDAYPVLRAHLSDAARGTPEGWADDPLAFFLTPIALLHGLLGARPDAPVGRLRLAPALPASWTSMELSKVRLGDATLDVGYTREGGASTFVLRPTGGAVPATVVFEPRAPGRVARVLVDGEPAEVETRPVGPRTAIRLQLPIDRERRVTLVGTDD